MRRTISGAPGEARSFVALPEVINVRPSQGNRSRSVEDNGLQSRIAEIVNRLNRNMLEMLADGQRSE